MTSTFTTGKAYLEQPGHGDYVDDWNIPLNADWAVVDACLSDALAVSLAAGDVTLSRSQTQVCRYVVTGALTQNVSLKLFNTGGTYIVANGTTGNYTVTVKTLSAGSVGVIIPQGYSGFLYTDGLNVVFADDALISYAVNIASPPGAIMSFAMSSAPQGWLKADGSAISRITYAALFAAIGTTWGAGDGTTTFNLPDLRGAFARGWDNGRGLDPSRSFGSLQTDAFKSHTHGVTDPQHSHRYNNPAISAPFGAAGGLNPASAQSAVANTDPASTNITINSTGDTETRPVNYAILYCIKY